MTDWKVETTPTTAFSKESISKTEITFGGTTAKFGNFFWGEKSPATIFKTE